MWRSRGFETGARLLPALAVAGLLALDGAALAGQETSAGRVPLFEVDTSWPETLPPTWTWRQPEESQSDVLGINADRGGHVWVTNRGIVAEFDPQGKLLQHWDARVQPGQTTIHGLYVDHNDFVWTTARDQHQILKFTRDGKHLLTIGTFGETGGSANTALLGRPAEVYVDEATNELFVVDGYTNRRVIVFDAATGRYLRHWGAYGRIPDDEAGDRPVAGEFAAVSQLSVPHGIAGSRDGLIYVADRTNSRIQVFRRNGEFVQEAFTRRGTGGAFSVALSMDPAQEFVYVTDGTEHRVWILRRSDMSVIGQFGQLGGGAGEVGRPHNITVDPSGNVYVSEGSPPNTAFGRRAQKFAFKGFGGR